MNSLPNEILLDIFEHLEYWDLRLRIPRVCRRFHILMEKGASLAIDRILFRDSGDQLQSNIKEYRLHPTLIQGIARNLWSSAADIEYHPDAFFRYDDRQGIQDVRFAQIDSLYVRGGATARLLETKPSPLDENLVSPGIKNLAFVYGPSDYNYPVEVIKSEQPITLGQLIDAVLKDFFVSIVRDTRIEVYWNGGDLAEGLIVGFVRETTGLTQRFIVYVEIMGIIEGCLRLRYQMPDIESLQIEMKYL